MSSRLRNSDGATCPRANTIDPVNSNSRDVSGWWVRHRWELDARPDVNLGQPLEELGGATRLDTSVAVENGVLSKAHGALCARLEGH